MSTPLNSMGAITLFEGPQRAKSFYQDVFDVSAIYEDDDLATHGVALLNGPRSREWACAPPASPIRTATSGRSRRSFPRTARR